LGPRCRSGAGSMVFRNKAITGGRRCTATWSLLRLGSCANRALSSSAWLRTCRSTKRCCRMCSRKILRPAPKGHVVKNLMDRYSAGTKRAYQCVRLHRSAWFYRSHRDPQTVLRQPIRELALSRVRFGYRWIMLLLKREGWGVGNNRLYLLYFEENLGSWRKRPWCHASAVHRNPKRPAGGSNEAGVGGRICRGPAVRWSTNSNTNDCGSIHARVSWHKGRL
jgi:hypothetical protein